MDYAYLKAIGLRPICCLSVGKQDLEGHGLRETGRQNQERRSAEDGVPPSQPSLADRTTEQVSSSRSVPCALQPSCRQVVQESAERRLLFLDVDGVLHPLLVQLLAGSQKIDTSHCFKPDCMKQLKRIITLTGAQIVVSSSWRKFEHARDMLADALAEYGLSFSEWTTTSGGETSDARVDQILAFVGRASKVSSWVVVDDEDLAPSFVEGSESMMRAVFRQNFVRTDKQVGLDSEKGDQLISKLIDESCSESEADDESRRNSEAMILARRCMQNFESVGWAAAASIDSVTSRLVQNLWSGLGSIAEISAMTCSGKRDIVVKQISCPKDTSNFETKRDYDSYGVEARFYDQGHAKQLCEVGARCPLPLHIDREQDGALTICMTRLPGLSCADGAGKREMIATLSWLARLHTKYWGVDRAHTAVRSGLHPQGCYWNLDARQKELRRTHTKGLDGRLLLAANALDARLKADGMQTICHGDPKDANIINPGDGSVALCDFQWIGQAPPTKDLAYCLVCGAQSLKLEEEQLYLEHYHSELSRFLLAQGDAAPPFDQLHDSYLLAMCDLARWMAGWGYWGHADVVKGHAATVLDKLDDGVLLASEDAYKSKMNLMFPL